MNGHIGFNEPGLHPLHIVFMRLAEQTVQVNKGQGRGGGTAAFALSMGIGTIMDAREIVLLANGDAKADIIRQAIQGPVTPDVPHPSSSGIRT